MLGANASYLYRFGKRVQDIPELLAFEIRQAEGINPLHRDEFAIDAGVNGSLLPLFFTRIYRQGILQRFRLGPLGRGWAHQWEMRLEEAADGTVTIFHMDDRLKTGCGHGRTYLTIVGVMDQQ